jgi:hypothetical protein
MKKIILVLIILFFNSNLIIYSQTPINKDRPISYQEALKEKIFVHYNSSFLLTGEYLYYKVYCIKARTNRLSNISKIAYVELVDSDKRVIFKHRIRLMYGFGDGSFFIPASIQSGNYKLIAYTQWMRNEGKNYFFQEDINIINPFNGSQKTGLKISDSQDDQKIELKESEKETVTTNRDANIELIVSSKTFSNRNKVSLKINSLNDKKSFGEYSVSVRKIDAFQIPKKHTALTYSSLYRNNKTKPKLLVNNQVDFLPELKGELLSGKVLFKNTKKPEPNVKVALSIPDNKYILKFANTDDVGVFNFNLEIEYEGTHGTIQVLNNERENYEIVLSQQTPLDYEGLVFKDFSVKLLKKELLLEYSIQNQIENAYSSVKRDTVSNKKPLQLFSNSNDSENYMLDDYTRFPTIRETVIEIIDNVWIRRKKGNYTFHVRGNDIYDKEVFLPLVIVDGILVQEYNELVNYNARKVKKISIVRDKFKFGTYNFQGIISIETFEKNYKSDFSEKYIKNIKLFKALTSKNYFNQIYDGSGKLDRIPDYRRQLLWKPNFSLDQKEAIITFYTSDITGDYEICFEGFNSEGKPISLREIISVK